MEAGTNQEYEVKSLVSEQLKQGFRSLRFHRLLEREFRQDAAREGSRISRPVVVVSACVVLAITIFSLLRPQSDAMIMAAYMVFTVLPVTVLTFLASYRPRLARWYGYLMAANTLLIGLAVTSITVRASGGGLSYYFAAQIGWLAMVWMILGLPFRLAAGVAVILSAAYVGGISSLGVSAGELWFGVFMLVNMNLIAAYSCYQLEYAARRAFLESRLLNELAQRDGLTGLYNRRSFDEYMERMWRQSRREQAQLTIMLIDIDHFKKFNDYYGHQAGDDALKQVAMLIEDRAKRPLDFAARYGGEEFALVLYGPGREYGQDLAEFLRTDVAALQIPNKGSATGVGLSVSIGVALVSADGDRSLAGAIQMADEALYQAKEEGRDRIVIKDGARTHLQTGRFRAKRAG